MLPALLPMFEMGQIVAVIMGALYTLFVCILGGEIFSLSLVVRHLVCADE